MRDAIITRAAVVVVPGRVRRRRPGRNSTTLIGRMISRSGVMIVSHLYGLLWGVECDDSVTPGIRGYGRIPPRSRIRAGKWLKLRPGHLLPTPPYVDCYYNMVYTRLKG
eukprot:1195713-Prorocentrum_minimum.AAC.5